MHCDACGTSVPHVHKPGPVLGAAYVKVTEAEALPSSLSKCTARQEGPSGSAVWGAWRVARSAFCRACPLSTGEGGSGQGPWSCRGLWLRSRGCPAFSCRGWPPALSQYFLERRGLTGCKRETPHLQSSGYRWTLMLLIQVSNLPPCPVAPGCPPWPESLAQQGTICPGCSLEDGHEECS